MSCNLVTGEGENSWLRRDGAFLPPPRYWLAPAAVEAASGPSAKRSYDLSHAGLLWAGRGAAPSVIDPGRHPVPRGAMPLPALDFSADALGFDLGDPRAGGPLVVLIRAAGHPGTRARALVLPVQGEDGVAAGLPAGMVSGAKPLRDRAGVLALAAFWWLWTALAPRNTPPKGN